MEENNNLNNVVSEETKPKLEFVQEDVNGNVTPLMTGSTVKGFDTKINRPLTKREKILVGIVVFLVIASSIYYIVQGIL